MSTEAVVIPIIIDPKAGVAGLKAVGDQAAKTNTEFEKGASSGGKLGASMKQMAGNALQMFGAFNLVHGATKILTEALLDAFTGQNKLASSSKMLQKIQAEAAESTKKEVVSLQLLYSVAKNTALTYGQRQDAINKLNKSYPELHNNLSLENIGTQKVADSINQVIKSLVRKAQVQGLISQIAELSNKADALSEIYKTLNRGPLKNSVGNELDKLGDRIDTLTKKASALSGENIGNAFGGLGAIAGKIPQTKEIHLGTKKLKIVPEKIEIPPSFNKGAVGNTDDFISKLLPGFSEGLGRYIQDQMADAARNKKYDLGIDAAASLGVGFQAQAEKAKNLLSEYQRQADVISSTLTPAFEGLFDAILSKQDGMQAFFAALGNSIKQLVKQLMAAAIQAMVLKLITAGASGGTSLLSGAAKAMAGTGIIFPFAEGGLVTGPVSALVGEGRGTNASNPEVVAPLDKLKTFFNEMLVGNRGFNAGNMGTAGTVVSMPEEVKLRMNGRELVGSFQLEILSQKRTG